MLNNTQISFVSYVIENDSVANRAEMCDLADAIDSLKLLVSKLERIERSETIHHHALIDRLLKR